MQMLTGRPLVQTAIEQTIDGPPAELHNFVGLDKHAVQTRSFEECRVRDGGMKGCDNKKGSQRDTLSNSQNKENVDSVAYIHFKRQDQVSRFAQAFNGHVFRDSKGEFLLSSLPTSALLIHAIVKARQARSQWSMLLSRKFRQSDKSKIHFRVR